MPAVQVLLAVVVLLVCMIFLLRCDFPVISIATTPAFFCERKIAINNSAGKENFPAGRVWMQPPDSNRVLSGTTTLFSFPIILSGCHETCGTSPYIRKMLEGYDLTGIKSIKSMVQFKSQAKMPALLLLI